MIYILVERKSIPRIFNMEKRLHTKQLVIIINFPTYFSAHTAFSKNFHIQPVLLSTCSPDSTFLIQNVNNIWKHQQKYISTSSMTNLWHCYTQTNISTNDSQWTKIWKNVQLNERVGMPRGQPKTESTIGHKKNNIRI